jgi:predicted flavoprotein YhiN
MKFLQEQLRDNPKKQIDSLLKQFFPLRFIQAFLFSIGMGGAWIMNTLNKHHLKVIAKEL